MDDHQLLAIKQLLDEHSKEHNAQVAQTIQTTVNGKIDGIKGDLNALSFKVTTHMADFATYKKEDEEFKVTLDPIIDFYKNLSGTNTVVLWLLKTLVLVGSAIGAIVYIKNYWK